MLRSGHGPSGGGAGKYVIMRHLYGFLSEKLFIILIKIDELVKSRHSREGGNPDARNFLKRMDSRLRTPDYEFRGQASGMTAIKRTFCDVVKNKKKLILPILDKLIDSKENLKTCLLWITI
ncbi:MAG: hypothetical protein WA126_04470 [Thermodesulfovibrionales bacterium]